MGLQLSAKNTRGQSWSQSHRCLGMQGAKQGEDKVSVYERDTKISAPGC